MANSDTNKEPPVPSQLSGKGENGLSEEISSGEREDLEKTKNTDGVKTAKYTPVVPGDAKSSQNTARPLLVQLGSNSAHALTNNLHPKRFSAVNINKKFLEKNSSASGSSSISSGSLANKAGGSTPRPQVQPSQSHSRLVTTKLTSVSPGSSTSGAGWSRPSSAAPPNPPGSHSPNDSSPLLPTSSLVVATATAGTPQLPHVGKVIQPQPRPVHIVPGLPQKDSIAGGSNKPVWGNVRPTAAPKRPDVQNDFPTAAEVAQVTLLRVAKLNDSREIAETAAANRQARMEEADTFRGVHLDPNTHHWDEMEEDDDNFLDGVIEFGDGRQYKIEPTLPPESSLLADSISPSAESTIPQSKIDPLKDPASNIPVSKEDRFVDDFDRSWPRSGTSPALAQDSPLPPGQTLGSTPPTPVSAPIVQDIRSPQETSRVLFNERSNRLEPYNSTQRTIPKNTHQESAASPTEIKSPREPLSISSPHNNIQLLQKPGSTDHPPRSRRFSGGSSGGLGPGHSGTYNRERDYPIRRDGTPQSPRMTRSNYGKGREFNAESESRSDMGPLQLPNQSRDSGQQISSHLSNTPILQEHISSRDSRSRPYGESNSAHLPSQSPVLSHASAARTTPIVAVSSLPQSAAPELDEVQRGFMQSAAARAKQRRQQEEEEREKEKERARQKAAELEERMKVFGVEKVKAVEDPKPENFAERQNAEVIAIIEGAVKSVQLTGDFSTSSTLQQPSRPTQRPPSLKGSLTQPSFDPAGPPRRQSTSASGIAAPLLSPTTPSGQADSWRSKASPLVSTRQIHTNHSTAAFLPPPPSVLEHVDALANPAEEGDLEVVDFSDMGAFVGASDDPKPTAIQKQSLPRPVASDFFEEHSPLVSANAQLTWGQRHSQDINGDPSVSPEWRDANSPSTIIQDPSRSGPTSSTLSTSDVVSTSIKEAPTSSDHHIQTITLPPSSNVLRTPRTPFYKEAALSAFDDAMSRIKGALDGMQAVESNKGTGPKIPSNPAEGSTFKPTAHPSLRKSSLPNERWVPPALRMRTWDNELHEVFHVTGVEPPRSPKSAQNAVIIRLPRSSRRLEPVDKKQLDLFTQPHQHVRWDILSFDPPVEGMDRRDFSLNDVLFRKSLGGYRGKPRYRVIVPRFRPSSKINIPHSQKLYGAGAFGRSSGADELPTWRKAPPGKPDPDNPAVSDPNTATRSPPSDIPTSDSSMTPTLDTSLPASTKSDGLPPPTRSRLQPKMPVGSAVAFYRDSRIDTVKEDPKPSVNFIVSSELEPRQGSQVTSNQSQPNITVTPPLNNQISDSTAECNDTVAPSSAEHTPPMHNKSVNQNSDNTIDCVPITPPIQHTAPWARTPLNIPVKEPTARGPDPEHLKAVWSQTSNKAGVHGVNSLEGIADDLTALPFIIQDVKSEDGETPPPSISAGPSRMSLHDVTRAFQQVPSSSSPSSSTPHRTPPITAPPMSRPSNYSYGLPPTVSSTGRPSYPYPSPIMSHSPPSNLMYPHPLAASPIPSRMSVNGHAPLYSQPMWMSMTGPTSQNHGNMMRPMASPYPAQLMTYPGGTPAIYGQPLPSMQNPSQQQTGGQASRDRSMPIMSPMVSHAGPAMYGSPVLMHAPVMQVPQNHSYVVQPNRNQARTDNGQISMQHSQQPNQSHPTYNPVSPSFVRSGW